MFIETTKTMSNNESSASDYRGRAIFRRSDLERHLKARWNEKGEKLGDNERLGVSIAELVSHSLSRNSAIDLPYVDLWVAILDECISWLISLDAVVHSGRLQHRKMENFERSIVVLLSKIVSDLTAIRHLVLAGFDGAARTIVRSVAEYMEVLVAVVHQPTFADEFVKSDTPEASHLFWQTHLRGGKLRRRITAAWADFFTTNAAHERSTATETFANWGRGSNALLSGSTHPSFGGGLLAAIPLKGKYEDENWLGTWGDKADFSVNTIYIITQFIFPVLILGSNFPFGFVREGDTEPFRAYDRNQELHRHVRTGRDILASLIISLCQEINRPFVFPEFDMSIWPEQPEPA
ncbi:hypothetical protein A6U87_05385 [Rhizobium sp. AC44/96]|uniref:hypothetical protein n=1 Tax=Rhizobium sp. AC44/96 TaxID=1841654 RepID=UPI0008294755|nr:hypothetical protein [Rhizobium sp. AC44/96]OCJ18322.1 hypothetical protein A6U87_05385 [Rhizobium sp. AC44/96]